MVEFTQNLLKFKKANAAKLESFGFKPGENFGVICEKELSLLSLIGDEKLDCELKLPRYFKYLENRSCKFNLNHN